MLFQHRACGQRKRLGGPQGGSFRGRSAEKQRDAVREHRLQRERHFLWGPGVGTVQSGARSVSGS